MSFFRFVEDFKITSYSKFYKNRFLLISDARSFLVEFARETLFVTTMSMCLSSLSTKISTLDETKRLRCRKIELILDCTMSSRCWAKDVIDELFAIVELQVVCIFNASIVSKSMIKTFANINSCNCKFVKFIFNHWKDTYL